MTLSDDVRNWSWWESEQWAKYCKAFDGSEAHRPVTQSSYVVDLSQEVKPSKGHRSAIRQQMERQHVRTCSTIEPFHRAHREAAGRETRTQSTWDLMDDWIESCHGLCVSNGEAGWAYVIVDPPGAYYASAAGRDTHFLHWKIIHGLRDAGFEWYELGMGHTIGIRTFKSGLANTVVDP